jgi:hypothetical protein
MVESDLSSFGSRSSIFNLKGRHNTELPSWIMLCIFVLQFTVFRFQSCISVLDFPSCTTVFVFRVVFQFLRFRSCSINF